MHEESSEMMLPSDLLAELNELGTQTSSGNFPSTTPTIPEIRAGEDPNDENRIGILLTRFDLEKDAEGKYPTEFTESREFVMLGHISIRGIEEYEDRNNSGKKRIHTDCFSVGPREIKSHGQIVGSAIGFGSYAHSQSGKLGNNCATCPGAPRPDGKGGTVKGCKTGVLVFAHDIKMGGLVLMRLSNTAARGPMQNAQDETYKSLLGFGRNFRNDQQGVLSRIAFAQGKSSSFDANPLMYTIEVTPGKYSGIASKLLTFKTGRPLSTTSAADIPLLQNIVRDARKVGKSDSGWGEVVISEIQRRLLRAVGNVSNLALEDTLAYFNGTNDVLPMYDTERMSALPTTQPAAPAKPAPAAPAKPAVEQLAKQPSVDDILDATYTPLDSATTDSADVGTISRIVAKLPDAAPYALNGSEDAALIAARAQLLTVIERVHTQSPADASGILTRAVALSGNAVQLNSLRERLEARYGSAA
ncbi:hypothetical protein IHN63_00405 [Deinococcus sp. 6YEL10]|uniref:hypothetical protein n=1 Tax=Deinococcus sp. 6YEL10 TaxID=2745870 RepID=UPI001E3DE5E3|nr:hypothetical protein [Deinococcus sp. 6YEL10]MCD0159760.1 hypothetical protein [Deinococcus sp. 6YEL10]